MCINFSTKTFTLSHLNIQFDSLKNMLLVKGSQYSV